MRSHVKVGFTNSDPKKLIASSSAKNTTKSDREVDGTVETKGKDDDGEIQDLVASMPKQVVQYFVQIPIQYRLLYLLGFLYAHQHEKVIVFASNCELVNFLETIIKTYDWNKCGRRKESEPAKGDAANEDKVYKQQLLFGGNIFKLHGDMNHEYRKINYFGFDKNQPDEKTKGAVLVCTDVASRGLDFKGVTWILQYDLSSQIKEYINRVGRTARIASSGSSLCFVMPNESGYPEYLKKKYGFEMHEKIRFNLFKDFEKIFPQENPTLLHSKFRKLVNIEDIDEK